MSTKTVLALGADMKSRFLLAKGKRFRFGPDISDLSDAENYGHFKEAVSKAVNKNKPSIVLCDLHPGYFSTRFAEKFGAKRIQHHHAHIASVMQEHNIRKPVIGVSFDGTGYGSDGNMWGGEFLLVDKKGFRRLAHLEYHPMPGGERVVKEPWRMVLGILGRKGFDFVKTAKKEDKEAILYMRAKNINSPLTSSAGRLFDASAALLGIAECAAYEAEGPVKLEAIARKGIDDMYEFDVIPAKAGIYTIKTTCLFLDICKDLRKRKDKAVISAKFHNSMAGIVIETIKLLSGVKDVALSGGVFQNKYLIEKTKEGLIRAGFKVFTNEKTPVNDYNISLGQFHVFSSTCKN